MAERNGRGSQDGKKEKKGGAVPWGAGAATQGAGSGPALVRVGTSTARGAGGRLASGAQGALGPGSLRNLINFLSSNLGMAIMASVVAGASVYSLYSMGMNAARTQRPGKKPGIFSARKPAYDAEALRGVPAYRRDSGGSLGMFGKANKGALEEAGARADADSASNHGSPAGSAASRDGAATDGSGQEGPAADAPSGHGHAPALAKVSGFTNARLGDAGGLRGGAGLSGGINRAFDTNVLARADRGSLSPLRTAATGQVIRAKTGASVRSSRKGAMGQLQKAASESHRGRTASASEAKSYHAAEAFTGGAPAAGGATIGGSGASGGAAIAGDGMGDEGGPMPSRGALTPAQTDAPASEGGEDATPWTGMVMLAMSLLVIASIVITILGILKESGTELASFGLSETVIQILYGIAMALAAAAVAIGIAIMMQYGQVMQGMIFTVGGAAAAAAAGYALIAGGTNAWIMIIGGVAGIAAAIGGLLAGKF